MAIVRGGGSGGGWFKPEEHVGAKAFLVEPKKILRDQPGTYGTRDVGVFDLTIFRNKEELDGSAEPLVLKGVRSSGAGFVGFCEDNMGDAGVCSLIKMPPKPPKAGYFAWGDVDDAIYDRVVAWVEKRDKEIDSVELPVF